MILQITLEKSRSIKIAHPGIRCRFKGLGSGTVGANNGYKIIGDNTDRSMLKLTLLMTLKIW